MPRPRARVRAKAAKSRSAIRRTTVPRCWPVRPPQFKLTVKKVEEQILPPVDDAFCRAYGVEEGGVETLRTEVRASMEREMTSVIRGRVRTQVMEALYRNNPLEVPKALVDDAAQQMQMDAGRRAGAREASQLPPREQFLDAARQRVALGMVMSEIVRSLSLTLDRSRVQTRVEDLVASFPNPEETRRSYLSNPEAMRQIESAVLEDQAIDAHSGKGQCHRPAHFIPGADGIWPE